MNDRQRLEAIVSVVCKYLPPDGISKEQAINEIIRLVDPLPEQEQGEHVAWLCEPDESGLYGLPLSDGACKKCFPVYRSPQQRTWVGLTENEKADVLIGLDGRIMDYDDVVDAVEAKLHEKNK